MVEKAFLNDLEALLGLLKNRPKQDNVFWEDVSADWKTYLEEAGENWRQAFIPVIRGIIEANVERLNVEFGMEFDIQNLYAQEFLKLDDYVIPFAQEIIDTTHEDVVLLLQQAMENGWSIPEMEEQLMLTWERYLDPKFTTEGRGLTDEETQWFVDRSPRYRREAIARTQTLGASNFGSFALYHAWGQDLGGGMYKEWLATFDPPRARETHMEAGLQYVEGGDPGPILLDEMFLVGGEPMLYPHQPGASAENTINCRCTLVPYRMEWAAL